MTRQISTQANYDKALARATPARADLQSAQVNEQQAEINLGYTNVVAPFDGVVSARQVSIGQLVGANSATVLSTIVQLDPIYANFTASERDVLQVRADLARAGRTVADLLGMPVEIGLQTESGYPHKGKLDYIAPTVDPSTGTIAARATLENADRACCPAISCACGYPRGRNRLCWCPTPRSAAIRADATCSSSTRTMSSNSARVEPGQLVGDLRVIEQGVTKDDRVVDRRHHARDPGPEGRPRAAFRGIELIEPCSAAARPRR